MDVHQPITLRAYMRHRNMDTPPTLELPPHVQRRHKRRSTASHLDSQMEEQEMMVLRAGIRPQWLQIHRIVNKRCVDNTVPLIRGVGVVLNASPGLYDGD